MLALHDLPKAPQSEVKFGLQCYKGRFFADDGFGNFLQVDTVRTVYSAIQDAIPEENPL